MRKEVSLMGTRKHQFYGDRLEELRKDKNIRQKELAKILGVDERTVSSYERNHIAPRVKNLIKISEYFNVTPDYFLGFTDEAIPCGNLVFIRLSSEYPEQMIKELNTFMAFLKFKYGIK